MTVGNERLHFSVVGMVWADVLPIDNSSIDWMERFLWNLGSRRTTQAPCRGHCPHLTSGGPTHLRTLDSAKPHPATGPVPQYTCRHLAHVRRPSRVAKPESGIPMKWRVAPFRCLRYQTVFNRVVVNVTDVSAQVRVCSNRVFPKAPLPKPIFAFFFFSSRIAELNDRAPTAGVVMFVQKRRPGYSLSD